MTELYASDWPSPLYPEQKLYCMKMFPSSSGSRDATPPPPPPLRPVNVTRKSLIYSQSIMMEALL